MAHWMTELARHYHKVRARYPDDRLLILFDIDGTILDMRCMILYLLRRYDQEHGTKYFQELKVDDIRVHENQVGNLLDELSLPRALAGKVADWFIEHRWSSNAIRKAHQPFAGVMEVIRWFQIQPLTSVGLNTGRPAVIREETLRSLIELGRRYRVSFSDKLLYMNPGDWEENVVASKVAGLRFFREAGYRVFAVVDNEPANLTTLAESEPEDELLLLHADTIFESSHLRLPASIVHGARYDITELISEKALPRKVQFVWHGLNDESNLRQFLASNVESAEFDVRRAPDGQLIVRHDSFEETPLQDDEEFLLLERVLERLDAFGKSIKIDIKEDGDLIARVAELLAEKGFTSDRLWFNSHIEVLGEAGFRELADVFPGTVIQCRIDFLLPLIEILPEEAKRILERLQGWGINRFSIPWGEPNLTHAVEQLDRWGFDVNIYNVPDLEAFLKAVLLQPRSVTSDFNFPKWHYYGLGSGQDGQRHAYEERKTGPHLDRRG